MSKPVVAFVCVHNACRSQIAEALCRLLAGDVLVQIDDLVVAEAEFSDISDYIHRQEMCWKAAPQERSRKTG